MFQAYSLTNETRSDRVVPVAMSKAAECAITTRHHHSWVTDKYTVAISSPNPATRGNHRILHKITAEIARKELNNSNPINSCTDSPIVFDCAKYSMQWWVGVMHIKNSPWTRTNSTTSVPKKAQVAKYFPEKMWYSQWFAVNSLTNYPHRSKSFLKRWQSLSCSRNSEPFMGTWSQELTTGYQRILSTASHSISLGCMLIQTDSLPACVQNSDYVNAYTYHASTGITVSKVSISYLHPGDRTEETNYKHLFLHLNHVFFQSMNYCNSQLHICH